ncbi:DUF6090 family protein [Eudoraea sp.]|uniref:DUF6090 family protein n=1 Tax=Eudoraea sp. TaxID=1979955 RepID=UPI003C788823
MINFFRNIRQKLLTENKFSKYLLYAIGEIILVVIGILIALGINNWNETRKQKATLSDYTESLIKDLQQDTIIVNEQIRFTNEDNRILENLIGRLSHPNANNDTLIKITRYELPSLYLYQRPLNTNTLLAIQSNGTLEYFDDKTYNSLIELQTIQNIKGTILNGQIEGHTIQYRAINSKYTIGEYKALSGPLTEEAWTNVDTYDLYRTVESFIASRKCMNVKGGINRNEILTATEKVLNRLIAIQKDMTGKK